MGRVILLGTGDSLSWERALSSLAVPLEGGEVALIDTSSGTVLLGSLRPQIFRSKTCVTCL